MTTSQTGQKEGDSLHFLDYWRIIRLRKGIIFLNFLIVVLASFFLTHLLPEQFKSAVRMEVRKDSSVDVPELGRLHADEPYDPYFILTQFERLQSSEVLYQVIDELGLVRLWSQRSGGKPLTRQQTLGLLEKSINPAQVRNTSIIELEVYSRDKEEAAQIANKIAEVYKSIRDEQRVEIATRGIATLEEKLLQQSNVVAHAYEEVKNVRESTGIDLVFESADQIATTIDTERLRALELQQIQYSAEYAQKKKELEELRRLSSTELRNAILTVKPQEILLTRYLEQYTTAEQEMISKGKDLGPSHPDMVRMRDLLNKIGSQVQERVAGIMKGLEAELAALEASNDDRLSMIEDAKQKNREAAEKGALYLDKKKNLERQERIRDTIEMKIRAEEVNRNIPRSAVSITDVAEPAIKPAWPKPMLNIAAGIIFGLAIGIGMAFFIEYLDTSVKTIDDVEHALNAPVLAVIPQKVGVLMEEGLDSPHCEPYRVLRTNIIFTSKNPDHTTITVVSGGAGEGKSTTVINLATIFAQNGNKVLLVDSDLRRPSLHKRLEVANSPGLTDCLLGQGRLEEVIQPTKQANLDFLPSGKLPSSAMGILNSQQMKEFVREVKEKYDYVLFDSPPLMGVSDATVLTSLVDLSLLVVQYRKYPQSLALRSRQMIDKVGGRLLGVVLNNINVSNDASYYYYSGSYYHSENTAEEVQLTPLGKAKRHVEPEASAPVDLKSKY